MTNICQAVLQRLLYCVWDNDFGCVYLMSFDNFWTEISQPAKPSSAICYNDITTPWSVTLEPGRVT